MDIGTHAHDTPTKHAAARVRFAAAAAAALPLVVEVERTKNGDATPRLESSRISVRIRPSENTGETDVAVLLRIVVQNLARGFNYHREPRGWESSCVVREAPSSLHGALWFCF